MTDDDEPLELPTPISGTLQSSLNGFKITDPVQFAKTFPIGGWCIGVQYCPRNKRNRTAAVQVYRGHYKAKNEKQLKGIRTRGGFGNQVTLKISGGRGSIKIYASPASGSSVSGTGVKGVQPMRDIMGALVEILNTSDDIKGFSKGASGVHYTADAIEVSCLNFACKINGWVQGRKVDDKPFSQYLAQLGYRIIKHSRIGFYIHYCYNVTQDGLDASHGVCVCNFINGSPVLGLESCKKSQKKHYSKGGGRMSGDCHILTIHLTIKGKIMIWGAKSELQAVEVTQAMNDAYQAFQRQASSMSTEDGSCGRCQGGRERRKRRRVGNDQETCVVNAVRVEDSDILSCDLPAVDAIPCVEV